MGREWVWRGGRVWTAFAVGAPAGLFFGVFELVAYDRPEKALFSGLIFGVLFGGWMSFVMWNRWKAAGQLSSRDRRAVAHSVLKGEPIGDPRLAPAVIEFAEAICRSQDRERAYRWTLWIWPMLMLALAVTATADDSTRQAVLWWVLLALGIVLTPMQRRRERGTRSAAALAERSARRLLGDSADRT